VLLEARSAGSGRIGTPSHRDQCQGQERFRVGDVAVDCFTRTEPRASPHLEEGPRRTLVLNVFVPCDHRRMVDVTLNESAGSVVVMKLQTQTWELNIWAPRTDFVRLHEIKDADWDARRSLAIGTCAGAPVYWAMSGDQTMILVGHDDETWDIAVAVPLATVEEIASLAERHR